MHMTWSPPRELPGSKEQPSISSAVRGCCSAMSKTKLREETETYNTSGWAELYSSVMLCSACVRQSAPLDHQTTAVQKNIQSAYSEVGVRQGNVKPADGEELLSSPEAPHDEPGQLLWPPDPPDRPAQTPQSHC